ncbi:MAG TPA: cysteine desulfurase NifS [Syntrophorhabdaceae bacterium]|nr:cysteine desulfurase NifS [Syntrophorhabdaceae bacterium]HQM80704.1 cysteine desulfurase NifS [Syntrophorhabdaceae bacterium]
MKRVYLDNNATTSLHPEVAASIVPFLEGLYGNPSSLHWAGRDVRIYYDRARLQIADMMHAHPEEIVVTSCGTESDNHAIKGIAYGNSEKGGHIITTAIEHPGVLNVCKYLEGKGFAVTYLPVDGKGQIEPDDVKKAIRKDTILISVMYANNETGTVFPIQEIGVIARERGVPFHSDMVQAMGKIDIDIHSLNVDLASFSGHKVYAPKGVGALYIREGLAIDNLIHGGHQENGRRAGTENVIGIVAFGAACEIVKREMRSEYNKIESLRKRLLEGILERIEDVRLNGHPTKRLPNTLNLSFEYVEAESLLMALDMNGIAVSSGSACSAGSTEPSHVLLAMGIPPEICQSAVRFSLGRENTEEDIDYVLSMVPEAVKRLRSMSPLYKK